MAKVIKLVVIVGIVVAGFVLLAANPDTTSASAADFLRSAADTVFNLVTDLGIVLWEFVEGLIRNLTNT